MIHDLAAQTFLYSTEAIVFGVLTFLLWMFYEGLGRQYVKFWTMSLGCVCLNHIIMVFDVQTALVAVTSPSKILIEWGKQTTFYLFLIYFALGMYCAKKSRRISAKNVRLYSAGVLILASFTTLTYATSTEHVFDRFFLRVSLQSFIYGATSLALGMFLLWNKPHHFSSRIFTYFCFVGGIKALLYSFASTLGLSEWWFASVQLFSIYFNVGMAAVLGFAMLIWMQGAERNAAISAINQAQYLGKHDSLTGTLNRTQVLAKLPALMKSTLGNNGKLCIMLIDIKRFKFINDTHGLKVGDAILGEVAERLRTSVFMPLLVGRLSGDSFVIVIDYNDEKQISHATKHIHELISRPFFFDDQDIVIQCSLGYCNFPQYAQTAEDLLQNANLALFHAESHNIETTKYDQNMQVQGRHLLAVEKEIKAGLKENQFELYFQPQLNLLTNKLEGVEALVRWNHPEQGLLTPNHFLSDVDTLGLNSIFDIYILEKACQAHKRWVDAYRKRITIAVNVTAVEFQDPKLVSKIQKMLIDHQMSPKYLELEITENVVMTDLQSGMDTIVVLQNMGIKVSIDDFGTGYSSLAYLRELPIDKIKIDRSFINEMASNDSDVTIVKSMVKLSHGLGKRVLAEGVETVEQLEMLRKLGCDAVQGYYISKPIPEASLVKYFSKNANT